MNVPSEKITSPIIFLSLLNILLAVDIVLGLSGGTAAITSWQALAQWATPSHVVAAFGIVGFSYFWGAALVTWGFYQIVGVLTELFPGLLTFLVLDAHDKSEAYRANSGNFIHKSALKNLAIQQDNTVAWQLWQANQRDAAKVRDSARHLTVLFSLTFLDWVYGGPFLNQIDHWSWHGLWFWGVYAFFLVVYAWFALQSDSDYVYAPGVKP